ncbi:MAG: hypothetical protein WBE37_12460 [Bryobacteraceae bacterium]
MSGLAEFQARQIVQRMHRLKSQVDLFATHAKLLRQSSASFDGRVLLQEADNLLQGLQASRVDFESANAQVGSLSRALPSRPPATGGPPPAAQWGNEFRAGSKQFMAAVHNAENELSQLYGAANTQLNSPTRTPTAPENLLDVLMNFIDLLTRWMEYRRRQKH